MQSFSGQDRLVVCVQDLHCNYEVQNNIARLIDDLAKQYGLDLVGVEGESLPINVASLSTFPLEKVKQETAHYLMKQGKITGPEMYAAIGRHAVRLQGIETQALYDNNREHVMSFLNHESQGYIYDLRETLNALKDSVYNQALAKIDEKKQAWREGDLSFLKYSVYIYEYGRQRKLNLKSYPNLSRYVSRQQNIFPKAVDSDELFKELEALDSNLRAGLYTSADQQVMDSLLHRLDIMEKLVNISAAPRDLSEFRENPEGFQVERFLEYIRQHDEAGEMRLDVEVYELNRYLQEVQAFYRIADRRSAAFVENMLSLMDKQQTKIAILVTGGYHTEEVLKELKHRKESYVSVKPCLRHQDVINPYFALLKNRRTPLEKLLAQNQNILSLPSNFMGPEAATFGKMMQYLFYEATMEEGISRGNTKISEIGAFVEKWMAAYVKRHNGIKANWADARMNETAGVYIVPFAGDYSMVVRPKGRLKLSPAAHERMINNLEFAMMNNRALAAMEAQLLKTGGRVVQGTKVQIALHGALVQAVPMGGRMVILAAPSLMSRVQSFSLSGALGGWQQDFYQLLPQGPAGLLKQGQELFGTGWERAVKTLKPLRFYLLGGALVSAGLGLVFLGVLPATAMSLLFIAGAVIPIIVLNKPFGLHLRPEIAILPALLLLATGPPAGDVEEGNQVSGSLLKRIVKAEAKGALPEPGAVLAANPRTPFVAEGIFKAAKEMNTFVLFEIALSQMVVNDHKGYSGMTARQFADMIYKAAAKEGFPKDRYALHADHMTVKENTWEAIQLAKDMIRDTVNAGYTSFTLDASYLFNSQPGLTVYKQLEDNIQVTAELAHYLKQLMGEREFAVEVEVGEIGGIDPKTGEKMLTTVEEAVAFIGALHEKGVYPDLLAINNGAVHGYTFDESGQKIAQTTIDLERTKEIAEALKKGFPDHPVKLHQSGGSGTPEETLAQFPASGILKVSVGADYMSAALDHLSVELYEKMKVWTLEHKSDEARRKGIASQDEIIGKYIKFAIAEFQESIAKISRKKRKNIAHAAYEVTLKYIAALNARDMAGNIEKSELDLSTGKSLLEHFSRKPESVSELIKTRSKANLNNPPRYGDPELWDTILEGFNPRHKIEFNRKFIHKKLGDSFGQMLTPAEYESLIREMQTKADILIFQLGEHGDHLYYFYDIKSNIVMRYKKNPEYDNPLFDDMFPYRDSFIRMRRLIKDKCYVINNKAARDFIFAKAEIQEAVKEERLNEIKSHLQAADQNYLRKMRWFQKNIILDMNSKMREEFWELLPEARGNYLELPSDEVPLYWQLPAWARKIYFYLPGDE
ncbi:class II fructose-bisphosphate aldolase, partial [bacterium]|nr:class II fructose-bisphosphate aldolase [bacterium]